MAVSLDKTQLSWKGNLYLSNDVFLQEDEQALLPKNILDDVRKGYGEILYAPMLHEFAQDGLHKKISLVPTQNGRSIELSYAEWGGLKTATKTVDLNQFPKLKQALQKAREVALQKVPHAFYVSRVQEAKETPGSVSEVSSSWQDAHAIVRNTLVLDEWSSLLPISNVVGAVQNIWCSMKTIWTGSAAKEGRYIRGVNVGSNLSSIGSAGMTFTTNIGNAVSYCGSSALRLSSQMVNFLSTIGSSFSLLMYTFTLGSSGYWLAGNSGICAFRNELMPILHQAQEDSWQKAEKGILFFQKQLKDKEHFTRMVGEYVANKVENDGKRLLRGIRNGNLNALKEAKDLIETANRTSFKFQLRNVFFVALAILGIAAAIISIVASCGASLGIGAAFLTVAGIGIGPSWLLAVSAGISLALYDSKWIYEKVGNTAFWCSSAKNRYRWKKPVTVFELARHAYRTGSLDPFWQGRKALPASYL